MAVATWLLWGSSSHPPLIAGWGVVAAVVAAALARRAPYRLRLGVVLGCTYMGVVLPLVHLRPMAVSFTEALAMVVVAGVLVGGRLAAAAAVLVLATFAVAFALVLSQRPGPWDMARVPVDWTVVLTAIVPPFVVVFVVVRRVVLRLSSALEGALAALTDAEAARALLVETEKMELVGRLAAAGAHDVNNALQMVTANAEALELDAADDEHREMARQIKEAARSAANLTRQMVVASRRGIVQPRPTDLARWAREASRAVRRVLPPSVQIEVRAPAPVWAMADPLEMSHLFLNLALNARDAMPEGGTLRLETRAEHGEAILEVSDTGVGMDEATASCVFDPFFTTKPSGQGTGLGLSNVRHVVEMHEGRIAFHTAVGKGTTFVVTLPGAPSADAAARPRLEAAPAPARILVIDTDLRVRAMMCGALAAAGHEVLEAADGTLGAAALERGPVDLLLTSAAVPGVSIAALVEAARARNRQTKVIVCSGYADDESVRRNLFAGDYRFLAKPFTRSDLFAAVRDVLREGGDPPLERAAESG
jgi:signal transduction histidine kinase/ActR/RegA family two-component response regulator